MVLSRFPNEKIRIGHDVEVIVVGVDRRSGKVRLGIKAPPEVPVHREEIYQAIEMELSGHYRDHGGEA